MSPQEKTLLSLSAVVVLGIFSQWAASRIRIPSILLLLSAGLLAGPGFGWIDPDQLLGELLLPVVSLSIALILFEGSMSLKLSQLRQIGRPLLMILTVGVLLTWSMTTAVGVWLLELPFRLALLLGAILTVTGPTVIGPMLRMIRPTGPAGPIARWEGIVIDPIGAILAVLIFGAESALSKAHFQSAAVDAFAGFLLTTIVGCGIGATSAWLLCLMLRRHWIPDHLESPFTLMIVVAAFAASNLLVHEAGLITVTVMGLLIANQSRVNVRHIVEFKENLSVLLISSLFILLSARLDFAAVARMSWRGPAFVAVMILVVRPVSVWISTMGSGLRRPDRIFLAWLAPRGIVAAAVASVFALELSSAEPQAEVLASATFAIIIGTVAVYGLTSGRLARLLGLSHPDPQGLLIAGAHRLAREIALALQKEKIPVQLVDTNTVNLRTARMLGIPVFAGNVLSERLQEEADLGGIGRLVALTSNDEVNALAARCFSELFGRANCYRLASSKEGHERRQASPEALSGRLLFSSQATFDALSHLIENGWTIRRTPLTAEFRMENFRERYGDSAMVLFVLGAEGRLLIASADAELSLTAGKTIIALTPAESV
ncbi:MAG: sodium:proton antiporter [Planctomycetaceae bacterium]|nr:sodium:proton antiporter [Planctomycetaceae bacterium]